MAKKVYIPKNIYELSGCIMLFEYGVSSVNYTMSDVSRTRMNGIVKNAKYVKLGLVEQSNQFKSYPVFVFDYKRKAYVSVGCRVFTLDEAKVWWSAKMETCTHREGRNWNRYLNILSIICGVDWVTDYCGGSPFNPQMLTHYHNMLWEWLKVNKLNPQKRVRDERPGFNW